MAFPKDFYGVERVQLTNLKEIIMVMVKDFVQLIVLHVEMVERIFKDVSLLKRLMEK